MKCDTHLSITLYSMCPGILTHTRTRVLIKPLPGRSLIIHTDCAAIVRHPDTCRSEKGIDYNVNIT